MYSKTIPQGLRDDYDTLLSRAVALSGLSREVLQGSRRLEAICWRYAIFLILVREGYSSLVIAGVSGKDHATVLHSANAMKDALNTGTPANFKKCYDALKSPLDGDEKIVTTFDRLRAWLHSAVPDEAVEDLLSRVSELK